MPRAGTPEPGVSFEVVTAEIAEHYDVEVARVQWDDELGCTKVLAHFGPHAGVEPTPCMEPRAEFEAFCHHVHRDLPLIIADRMGVDLHAQQLVLEGEQYQFYAAVPLVLDDIGRCGAVSILGKARRPNFQLKDCEFLRAKAEEVASMCHTAAPQRSEEGNPIMECQYEGSRPASLSSLLRTARRFTRPGSHSRAGAKA